MQATPSGHWIDDPINDITEDEYSRSEYASRAADLIVASQSWESSVVFGLTGAWGSGKSSLVRMLTQHIMARHSDWSIAEFTPWATSDLEGLLAEFYGAIARALPKDRRKAFLKSAGRLLKIASPAGKLIPYVGDIAESAASQAADLLSGAQPWSQQFAETAATLRALGRHVLVVADDIDRLQADELLGLLKVIRLLGRFPGVQYLLAYDDQTVFRTLQSSSVVGGDPNAAQRFMEKIVQYPLIVPPLLKHQQLETLEQGLSEIFSARRDFDLSEFSDIANFLQKHLTTPRSIGRFLAQLRHHVPMLAAEEINDLDLVRVTLLRTAFPSAYALLPVWRDALISGHTGQPSAEDLTKYQRFDGQALLRDINPIDAKDAMSLLSSLFPRIEPRASESVVWGDRRMCDDAYFDRYLFMGISSADVSNLQLMDALAESLKGNDRPLNQLILESKPARSYLALDKIGILIPEDDDARQAIAAKVAAMLDQFSRDRLSTWFSPRIRARTLIAEILEALSDKASPDAIVQTVISLEILDAMRIYHAVARMSEKVWITTLRDSVVGRSIDLLIASLALHDAAPMDDSAIRCLYFAFHEDRPRLISTVGEALKSKRFTYDDLAARLVSGDPSVDPFSELPTLVFDRPTWDALAEAIEVPAEPADAVDEPAQGDLSWQNRRLFARRQVS